MVKRRAAAARRLDGDGAAVLGDDLVHQREAEAGGAPARLGGEEGVEDCGR
jgi:hypothetical protein